jgi:hypothetical protein
MAHVEDVALWACLQQHTLHLRLNHLLQVHKDSSSSSSSVYSLANNS